RRHCVAALQRPQPRLALGQALRGLASAMLDVSDGLLGDLSHILARSGVGAVINAGALPLAALRATGAPDDRALSFLLSGGDDYELLFTARADARAGLDALSHRLGQPLHRIGHITAQAGECLLLATDGRRLALDAAGYDHFA
ncbi:thiamine-phosphate kinase, partial [Thauera linaloolentis]